MSNYRKKPVVIDAVQWHGFKKGPRDLGVSPLSPEGSTHPTKGWIGTLEGVHEVTPGDWIITGVKGEKYPCKPDIFEMTYEPLRRCDINHPTPSISESEHAFAQRRVPDYKAMYEAMKDRVERLEAQRDALLEALKVTHDLHGRSIALTQARQDTFDAADKLVAAAIAKAEGGAL